MCSNEFIYRILILDTNLTTAMFFILIISIPLWVRFVWSNQIVHDLLVSGWSPLFMAMIIARCVIIMIMGSSVVT